MRKVTQQISAAFLNRQRLSVGNTMTDGATIFLHGNAIVRHSKAGIEFSLAGWATPTTKERINGVLSILGKQTVRFVQRAPHYGNKPIQIFEWIPV